MCLEGGEVYIDSFSSFFFNINLNKTIMYKTHKIYAVETTKDNNARLWLCYGALHAEWVYAHSMEEAERQSKTMECTPHHLYIVDGEPNKGETYININKPLPIDKRVCRAGNTFDIGGLKVLATTNPSIHPEILNIKNRWVKKYCKNTFEEIEVQYNEKEFTNSNDKYYAIHSYAKGYISIQTTPNKWYTKEQVLNLLEKSIEDSLNHGYGLAKGITTLSKETFKTNYLNNVL